MRRINVAWMVALMVVTGVAWMAFAQARSGETKTIEGELIDMHCYVGMGAKGAAHASCGTKCAASGIPVAVLAADGKAYTLITNPKPLADSVSKTIRVTGTVKQDVMAMTADKVEVKDGNNWKEITLEKAPM